MSVDDVYDSNMIDKVENENGNEKTEMKEERKIDEISFEEMMRYGCAWRTFWRLF